MLQFGIHNDHFLNVTVKIKSIFSLNSIFLTLNLMLQKSCWRTADNVEMVSMMLV